MKYLDETGLARVWNKVKALIPTRTSELINDSGFLTEHQDISGKQDTLVSGTNIKTINNQSLLGSGNIDVSGGGGGVIVEQKTKSVGNISSGDAFNGNFSVAKDGYAPIGVVGYQCSGSGTTYINMTQLYVNNGAVYYYGRNTRSGATTLTLYVWVMYAKN